MQIYIRSKSLRLADEQKKYLANLQDSFTVDNEAFVLTDNYAPVDNFNLMYFY